MHKQQENTWQSSALCFDFKRKTTYQRANMGLIFVSKCLLVSIFKILIPGYIVSRQTKDNCTVYSQIIRIYPAQNDLYQVALLDLRRKEGFLPSNQFHARHFELEMPR